MQYKAIACCTFLLIHTLLVGCKTEPEQFRFSVVTSGGPKGWPIWIENLTFDNRWGVPAGSHESGFGKQPPRGGTVGLGDSVVAPKSLQARWFSYRTQTYYKIDLTLPDSMEDKLKAWYEKYPVSEYQHYLVTAFSGKGEVQVWWHAWCSQCDLYDDSEDFSTPIIKAARGKTYEPEVIGHKAQTKELVERGVIPSPWEDKASQ